MQRLVGWVYRDDQLLDPLVGALGRYTLARSKVHADDTPVPVLSPGLGNTKTGRLWVYVRDDRPAGSKNAPAAWYQYSPNRKGEHPSLNDDELDRLGDLLEKAGLTGKNIEWIAA